MSGPAAASGGAGGDGGGARRAPGRATRTGVCASRPTASRTPPSLPFAQTLESPFTSLPSPCLPPADYDEETKMTIETSADVTVVPTFDAMGLKEDLLRGIYSYGPSPSFSSPSAVLMS